LKPWLGKLETKDQILYEHNKKPGSGEKPLRKAITFIKINKIM